MKNLPNVTREQFIQEVIIPQNQHLAQADITFAIKDENFCYVLCSDKFAKWLGLSSGLAIAGKKAGDFPQFSKMIAEESQNTDNMVKIYQKPIEEVLVIGDNQTVIVNKIPLFYPDGSFFGIRETIRKFELIYPFQVMNGMMNNRDQLRAPSTEETVLEISEEEKSVLFLLLSGHGRSYIAQLMKVNISKVSRIISELCNKFGVISHHQERLVNCVINKGVFRFVPEIIMKKLLANVSNS
jgi:predicted transcriptional regulator